MKAGDLVEVDQDWNGMKPPVTRVTVVYVGISYHDDHHRDDLVKVLAGEELIWYHRDRLTPLQDQELSTDQLEWVVGGQNYERHQRWRYKFLNAHNIKLSRGDQ